MCIIREYVYSLIFSGNVYIPWFTQGIYIYPEKSREYTYSLKFMSDFYTLSLNWLFSDLPGTVTDNEVGYVNIQPWDLFIIQLKLANRLRHQ